MKKNKIVLLILIFIIVAFILCLTIYVFSGSNSKKFNWYNYNIFTKASMEKTNYDRKNKIINKENINYFLGNYFEYEKSLTIDNKTLNLKIYIDNDSKLIIMDKDTSKTKQISDKLFYSLYFINMGDADYIIFYAIGLNARVYQISLLSADIDDIYIEEIDGYNDVSDFISSEPIKLYDYTSLETYVFNKDKIVEIISGVTYENGIYNINDKYFVDDDGYIYDSEGYRINNYKLKAYFKIVKPVTSFPDNPDIVLITDTDELIYVSRGYLYKSNDKIIEMLIDDNINLYINKNDVITINGEIYIFSKIIISTDEQ